MTTPPRRNERARRTLFAIGLWAAGVVAGTAWQWHRVSAIHAERTRAAYDGAHAVLSQRLEHNEALLDGLAALLRASGVPGTGALRGYADELLARYPHLHTIGYQPRVEHRVRAAFEQETALRLGRPFRIKSFAFDGDRVWREAPPREVYYPVTFMAPDTAATQAVLGFDGYDDPRFRDAIERARLEDRPVPTLPFDLSEGGRGYVFFRTLGRAGAAEGPTAEHLVSIVIRADRLLAGIALPDGMRLALRHAGRRSDAGVVGQVGALTLDAERPLAPSLAAPLEIARPIGSRHQSFELLLQAGSVWNDWPRAESALWAGWIAAWTLLAWAAATVLAVLRRTQRQRERAERDLAGAGERTDDARTRSLEELAAGIAHELNQPLAAVLGYNQAAMRLIDRTSAAQDPQLREHLKRALGAACAQAQRASDLVERLRGMVRSRSARRQRVRLADVVDAALRLERARVREAAVGVQWQRPADDPWIEGDALLLEQVLSNLLRNAVEAMAGQREPRRIDVTLASLDGGARCRLVVADTGPGLPADRIDHLFHPFRSTKPHGAGLGLMVCAAIVRAHDGTIGVDNTRGGGARFTIELPAAAVAPAPAAR
jgi:signal transduction histidine kinase